jgi:phosphohistidine phosphatase
MKTLLLVRHAKSSWDDASIPDFERPLNDRGKEDAPEMAKRIKKKVKIDVFVSSPAKRAKKTCKLFMEELGAEKEEIILEQELYEADEKNFYNVIERIDDKFETAAIFSHNPGITYFANIITGTRIDNMPTCSIVAVKLDTNKWAEIRQAKRELLFFDYPKSLAD